MFMKKTFKQMQQRFKNSDSEHQEIRIEITEGTASDEMGGTFPQLSTGTHKGY